MSLTFAVGTAADYTQTQPFRLLDLPPELWVRIGKLAVPAETIVLPDSVSQKHICNRVKQPAITRVCKTLRHELLALYYQQNVFVMIEDHGYSFAPERWLEAIGTEHRRRIGCLLRTSDCQDIVEWVGLQELLVNVSLSRDVPFLRDFQLWNYTVRVVLES